MRRRALALLGLLALAVSLGAFVPAAGAQGQQGGLDRFTIANGCFGLRSVGLNRPVVTGSGPFRMQATTLGEYLLYGPKGQFLAAVGGDRVGEARVPSVATEFRVEQAGDAFRIVSLAGEKALRANGDGTLALGAPDTDAARFTFERADGCATYPEIETNVTGEPSGNPVAFGETRGLVDAHMHMMAFEFLGGRAHCGRPWHKYGVAFALVDCPDHAGNGAGAALENGTYKGSPARTHDTDGWPTFRGWPDPRSLTHENSYYKWVERAWRGGLRVYVNLAVENQVLCEVYPLKQNSCDEMVSVRRQLVRINELQDYIDAQAGGPGKGFFRIVRTPFEARRVINEGKLAVILGIENSKLFGCGLQNGKPECDKASITRDLDEFYDLGVRDLELINKFDNALGGVAGDSGSTGVLTGGGNFLETGRFIDFQECQGESEDRPQISVPGSDRDELAGNVLALAPPGATPAYPPPPNCNTYGLSELGEHLIRGMMRKGMIIDPDHLSVLARRQALAITESERYSGVISSHSWSDDESYGRILKAGGIVTPYAGSTKDFVKAWRETKPKRNANFYFGFGWGADMNGLGSQGLPRGKDAPNPVTYPFKTFDGKGTVQQQRSGSRTYDINVDGVSHYGMYPDWLEDLRKLAGDEIVEDMARGSEAYLQMWERANGVPVTRCQPARNRFSKNGLGRLRIGETPEQTLRRAGQPKARPGRAWSYCVQQRDGRPAGALTSVLSPEGVVSLVASTGPEHDARGVSTGDRAAKVKNAKKVGTGLLTTDAGSKRRFVFGVRGGRVRFVAVTSRAVASTPARLRSALRVAGMGV